MTQNPCTSPTGCRPRSRQAAKSGTVSPEEKADDSRRRTAASGRSSELRSSVAHQLSSEMIVIGLGSVTSPVVLVTAVPSARNSMVWEPHWCDFSSRRTPTIPLALS